MIADTEPSTARDSEPASGERYAIGTEIARGGMGRVVEASDTLLGRAVALKEALCEDDEGLRRFARETRITARLEHPSIVPIYDAGRSATGRPYYVMRKVAGRPLEKLVHEHPTARERLALLPHLLAAVEAVAHAHERGVIHRDLKPTNILVGTRGETMVIDWGLARELDDPEEDPTEDIPATIDPGASLKTRIGSVFGTPGFMAPEQVGGIAVTPACDVYALGATLYHMLAAVPPHAAPTGDEMMQLAAKGPPKPLLELQPTTPRELATIVARAMAHDERERYRDAGELASELRRFLTGQLVAAHPYSRRERLVRFVRRHRAAVAVSAIAIVALGLLGGISISRVVDERNQATSAKQLALAAQRTAEAARLREAARADDLLVAQAAALVADNPIAAVGLLHRLPPVSESWRMARDVLADARRRGVPFALPASQDTSGLAVTRDGTLAYSAGTDGAIRRHELATGKSELLHQLGGQGGTVLALTGDERSLVVAGERSELVWIDVASGEIDVVPVPASPQHLASLAAGVVWSDSAKVPWQLVRGGAPTRLPGTFEHVGSLRMAPDHAHVVIDGRPEWMIVALGDRPRIVARFPDKRASHAWSRDGKRLAIGYAGGLDILELAGPAKPRTIAKDRQVFASAFVGDDLYYAGNDQLLHFYDADTGETEVMPVARAMYSQAFSTRDAAVFVATGSGLAVVIGRGGPTTIRTPSRYVFRSAGNLGATRFVVSARDHLFAYDTSAMTPRVIDTFLGNTIYRGFATSRHYLMGYMVDDWQLFDVETGDSHTVGPVRFGVFMSAPPDASYLLVRPDKSKGVAVARAGKPLQRLHDDALAVARSPAHALLATPHEAIEVEIATGRQTPLWRSADPIIRIAGNGTVAAVATAKQLWRTTGARHDTLALAQPFQAFEIASDGTVYVASETAVSRWSLDGAVSEHCRVASPPVLLRVYPRVGVVAVDREHEAWTCEPNAPAKRALPEGFSYQDLSRRAPFAATLTHDDRLAVYDLETRHQWTLGDGELAVADLAPDGRHVATYSYARLAIYALGLPEDRAGYQRLLEATTNLRIGDTPNQIIWPAR